MHRAVPAEMQFHVEAVFQVDRFVSAGQQGALQVFRELGPVIGVGAVPDNGSGALDRIQSAQVRHPLFCHEDHRIVFCVVRVGDHGDDLGDAAAFRGGWRAEESQVAVAHVVAAAADAVHHTVAQDMGGIGLPVDVEFDGGVQGDDAQPPDDAGIIAHIQGPEHQGLFIQARIFLVHLPDPWRWGKGAARRGGDFAHPDEIEDRILQDFRIHGQVLEIGLFQASQDGVGDAADTGLEGQHLFREATVALFVLQKIDQVGRDFLLSSSGGVRSRT